MGMAGNVDPGLFAVKRDIGNHQVDISLRHDVQRVVVILHCRGDAISRDFQYMFIVEGDERLILHDQDAANRPLPFPRSSVPFD
jgi:predicted lipid carrier protein YhbT